MTKFTLTYLDHSKSVASAPYEFHCKDYKEAVIKFCRKKPSDFPYVQYISFIGGRHRVENPYPQKRQLSEKKEKEAAKRFNSLDFLNEIITIIESTSGAPLRLSFDQLEFLIENFYLFPTLEKGDEEIYSLREKLYMLSFWNTALQSSLQTRLLSQIASVTSAPQTGSSGSGQPKWAPLATSVALSKLSNIEKDVDDVADGFLGED